MPGAAERVRRRARPGALDAYAGLFSDDLDDVADRMDSLVPQTCHIGRNDEPLGNSKDEQVPDLQV